MSEPPGLCKLLDINLRFATPRNGKAKSIERSYLTQSRQIDDCPEFAGAHAGHAPGERSDAIRPVTLAVFEAVYRRRTAEWDAEPGRDIPAGDGRQSANQIFAQGLAERNAARRPTRKASPLELRLASLVWPKATPDEFGRVTAPKELGGAFFGGQVGDHQDTLMKIRRHGEKIWLGINPANLNASAAIMKQDGALLIGDLRVHTPSRYKTPDEAQAEHRQRDIIQKAEKRLEKAHSDDDAARLSKYRVESDDDGDTPNRFDLVFPLATIPYDWEAKEASGRNL